MAYSFRRFCDGVEVDVPSRCRRRDGHADSASAQQGTDHTGCAATTGDAGCAATTTRAEGSSPKFTSVISHSSTTGASTSRAAATGKGGGGAWTSANNLTENRAINP